MRPTLMCHQTATTRHSPQFGCQCCGDVHQHPMVKGFMGAAAEAEDRLAAGWTTPPCPDCGHFGWLPPTS